MRKLIPLVLFITLLILSMTSSASAAVTILRVDGTNGSATPTGNGNAWGSNAFKYLRDPTVRGRPVRCPHH
jgi:hypothetical protein